VDLAKVGLPMQQWKNYQSKDLASIVRIVGKKQDAK